MDLNPIEHACGILQRGVSAGPVQPRTLQELKDALVAEWRLILQNRIQTLITSTCRRCRAVIDALDVIRIIKQVFNNKLNSM